MNNKFDHKLSTTLVISLVYPLGPFASILMPLIVGGVIDTYGFTEQQAGTIASSEGIGLVIASVIASFWIRKISWTKMLFISLLLTALVNVISANVSDFTLLLSLRFIAGLTAGTIFAITVAALGDNKAPDRAFGIAQAAQCIMMGSAFAVAPYLMAGWDVSGVYYMLAASYIVMMVTLVRFPSKGIEPGDRANQSTEKTNMFLIWLGLFASVLFFINVFGFWAFTERIGHAAGLSAETIGFALGISQIIAFFGALAAAIASDRYGRMLPLLIVFMGQTIVLWLLVGQFSSMTFFVGAGVFQALFMVGVSYQMGAIAKIDIKGRFLVMMTAAQGVGAAVGPSLAAAFITSDGDYSGINMMAAVSGLLCVAIFIFVIKRSQNN